MSLATTSLQARADLRPTLPRREAEVLAILEEHPAGLCGWEVAHRLGKHPYVVRPRLTDLADPMKHDPILVIRTDQKRLNPAGKWEVVWRMAPPGGEHQITLDDLEHVCGKP